MTAQEAFLQELAFPRAHWVEGRSSIADLFKPGRRSGIYVLHFAGDEHYCGQAVDVTRRYVQHCKNHPDILRLRFKEVEQAQLNAEERRCIRALEAQGYRLRNIALTSIPYGESDFDLIMSPEAQRRWREDLTFCDLHGPRVQNEDLRSKYQRKYMKLLQEPDIEAVMEVMRRYAQTCLPALRRGEMSFWNCSCLPGSQNRELKVYSRINIYWQEVLTVGWDKLCKQPFFTFHMAKSPLKDQNLIDTLLMRFRVPSLDQYDHQYEPGGQDQCAVTVNGCKDALKVLEDRNLLSSTRLFNLRLMQKGACNFSRNHCLDLADRLIEG